MEPSPNTENEQLPPKSDSNEILYYKQKKSLVDPSIPDQALKI
jgi:hypothetical protein